MKREGRNKARYVQIYYNINNEHVNISNGYSHLYYINCCIFVPHACAFQLSLIHCHDNYFFYPLDKDFYLEVTRHKYSNKNSPKLTQYVT